MRNRKVGLLQSELGQWEGTALEGWAARKAAGLFIGKMDCGG